ncbi:hypothetical protein E2562_020977 [Oryza meyeriana var. granulata]|uniref:Uncharacterized protein n=1 Tax=Oryza meyeriana var. granulata TaxID=110450 RepID=A0A6G1DYR4_9ORYZ|nr:hypothetical protein E2562_020977 [Oryza meyeriana var. granulata]KAF0917607.1 hypothetical protein E2562_020977 [Oryza meyeriana var. granulata]
MLSTLPAVWSELGSGKPAWELTAGGAASDDHSAAAFDESALLASRLCQHQIDGGGDKPIMLQLSDLHCDQALYNGFGANAWRRRHVAAVVWAGRINAGAELRRWSCHGGGAPPPNDAQSPALISYSPSWNLSHHHGICTAASESGHRPPRPQVDGGCGARHRLPRHRPRCHQIFPV